MPGPFCCFISLMLLLLIAGSKPPAMLSAPSPTPAPAQPGTRCMWRHFGYGVSSTVSWQHGSGVDIKGCTSLLRLCMAAAGQCPSPRHLDTTICPHCCRSLRPALTQLLPTEDWGLCHLGNLCSGSLGNLEKTMEAINYLPKITQVVKRGTDPRSLQTLTMAPQ